MRNVLIVGATRGLGASLTQEYASQEDAFVYATARSSKPPTPSSKNIRYIPNVDIATESAGEAIISDILPSENKPLDVVVLTAGYFGLESFEKPDWDAEVKMYSVSAIGPVFVVSHLAKAGLLKKGAKVILVSSESGSVTLRHESEGGGLYGHHASKTAMNMVGKLLSFDLKEREVAVGILHPGFMRTEMTKSVGFDKFWDAGGAITPVEAAKSLVEWIEGFGMDKSGQYWAPRGPADIGTAEPVLGPKKDLSTPLQLPW